MASADHDTIPRCLYCGGPLSIIWVHGHGQCAHCGTNIDECCRGECHAPATAGRETADREPGVPREATA